MSDYVEMIRMSKKTIYEFDASLYLPTEQLSAILNLSLVGLELTGLPLRTRSKVVKTAICNALGYPVPASFKKTQPKFPAQNFDIYTQKSLNVQVWNEEIAADRRYVLLRLDEDDVVVKVKIITGEELVKYDNTGTLTKKFQATMAAYGSSQLFSPLDTPAIAAWIGHTPSLLAISPNANPTKGTMLSVQAVYDKLLPLVGKTIQYLDALQERNRGAELHKRICLALGYAQYEDNGSYPDILNQLVEIKLQTSPTIDLGLHSPEDGAVVFHSLDARFVSADIRYVIFAGKVQGKKIVLENLYVVNGADFTEHFPLFKGKVENAKRQVPLPINFFD